MAETCCEISASPVPIGNLSPMNILTTNCSWESHSKGEEQPAPHPLTQRKWSHQHCTHKAVSQASIENCSSYKVAYCAQRCSNKKEVGDDVGYARHSTIWNVNRNCHNGSFHKKSKGTQSLSIPAPLHPWSHIMKRLKVNAGSLLWITVFATCFITSAAAMYSSCLANSRIGVM